VQGRLGVSGKPVVTTLVCFFISHTRLRVRRAPGFPCALFQKGGIYWHTSDASRREIAEVWLNEMFEICFLPSLRAR
jgi:hypothetical protein